MEGASPLKAWTDFYVIVGSSAAALTGLMFVVITLVAGVRARTTRGGIAAFSTPTVVHFCAVLLIGATVTAPWPRLAYLSALVAVAAAIGIAYSLHVIRHAREAPSETGYTPDLEDWLCYVILPTASYVLMLASSVTLALRPELALFGLAATALLLIFLGIHNAWDVVTYISVSRMTASSEDEAEPPVSG